MIEVSAAAALLGQSEVCSQELHPGHAQQQAPVLRSAPDDLVAAGGLAGSRSRAAGTSLHGSEESLRKRWPDPLCCSARPWLVGVLPFFFFSL